MFRADHVYIGDSAKILAEFPDACVDLTVTSPPYDSIRTYQKGNTFDYRLTANELFRVTKQGGVVVWVVGDETKNGSESLSSFHQAIYFCDVCGFNLHDTMIYRKENPPPLNHNRYEQAFEYMFVFSKGVPATFNPIMKKSLMAGKMRGGTMRNGGPDDLQPKHTLGRYPTQSVRDNIFSYVVGNESDNKGRHPAIFPEALARDHILSWSKAGDIVLDCFAGSGTTLKAAKQLGRQYVGIEISEEYVNKIILPRLENTNDPLLIVEAGQ